LCLIDRESTVFVSVSKSKFRAIGLAIDIMTLAQKHQNHSHHHHRQSVFHRLVFNITERELFSRINRKSGET
jgi:hypothetical protein